MTTQFLLVLGWGFMAAAFTTKAKEGHVNQALWDWTHTWQWHRKNVAKDGTVVCSATRYGTLE